MTRSPFGWSLPPGVSQRDIDAAAGADYEPTLESEHICALIEQMREAEAAEEHDSAQKTEDKIVFYVDELAGRLMLARELLRATLRHLPERGPAPPCTCHIQDQEWPYCQLHEGDWQEQTLKEEIEGLLKQPPVERT